MKAHNVGFSDYLKESFGNMGIPPDEDDDHKFNVLLSEIAKSGPEYALTSYYGEKEAIRLLNKFIGPEAGQAAAKYLDSIDELNILLAPRLKGYED